MNWDRGGPERGLGGFGDTSARAAAAAVDVAVLQELRAIREDLGKKLDTLAERVGQSATRDDLDDYVRKDVFDGLRRDLDEHEKDHDRMVEGWRGWLPIVLSAVALLWIVVGPYVHFGPR